jgi:enediyne biosynthesis protein E4
VFIYSNGKLGPGKEVSNSSGWWNCITASDIDNDGDVDLIAGNTGLNSRIRADKDHPSKLYAGDFDNNGRTECIPAYYKPDGKIYPYHMKGELQTALPGLKKKFLRFDAYAGKSVEDVLGADQLKRASVLEVKETRTTIFINDGHGNFTLRPLPLMAQLSPVFAILHVDINGDSIKDLFLAGNFFGLKPQGGRFDASYGTTLLGNGRGEFKYVKPAESGLFIKGEARDVLSVQTAKGNCIVVAMNDGPLYVFRKK